MPRRNDRDNTAGATDITVETGECYTRATATKIANGSAAIPLKQSVTIGGTFAAARPEIYQIQIGGTWAANDTLTIGSTTYTAKATTPTGNQFSAGGTGAVIVEDIRAAG